MPCKQRREITSVLLVASFFFFYTVQVCHSVSLGPRQDEHSKTNRVQESNTTILEKLPTHMDAQQVIQEPAVLQASPPGLSEPQTGSDGHTPDHLSAPPLEEGDFVVSVGKVRRETRSPDQDGDGYQGDATGYHEVQGKVLGPSMISGQHVPEWQDLKPLVKCGDRGMVFTAAGKAFPHLSVDTGTAPPVSLLQLPPYCGFLLKTSLSGLEMIVPYDGCYMLQENGSYVLPLLWWGSPLKLSCPMPLSSPAPPSSRSSLSVLCSHYGMVVQVHVQEQHVPTLAYIVNEGWGPFLSEDCAYHVHSFPGEHAFFILYTAPCITRRNGIQLHLTLDYERYVLSCPVSPQFPYVPSSPVAPGHPQYPKIPDLDQFPQIYPPSPQAAHPTQPTLDSPPGTQQPKQSQQSQQHFYPTWPYSPEDTPNYPLPPHQPFVVVQAPSYPVPSPGLESSSQQLSKLPGDPSQYPAGMYYPIVPVYYHAAIPAPILDPKQTTATAPPATHPPKVPPAPPSKPKPQVDQSFPNYPNGPHSVSTPDLEWPESHLSPQKPIYNPFPPTKEEPQKPGPVQGPCPPGMHTICSYFPYPNPTYPSLPQYPQPPPPVTTKKPFTTPTEPSSQFTHQLKCLTETMVVFLPFAHRDSIQVRDHMHKWLPLSSMPPQCEFRLQEAEGFGVILHSPLPACHSQPWSPTTVSLPLKFWDTSKSQYITLELKCPYPTTSGTPSKVSPPAPPSPPSSPKFEVSPPVAPKPKVFCFSTQMAVELPAGPISEIAFKDIKGSPMSLQDAQRHCGYSARNGKDGKILLRLPLHSRCHMRLQDKMYIITIFYVTVNGKREAQLSCPVAPPAPGQECNLPSEQRLPCGHGSVSQSQCLSMGCCFSKHPPACYYRMDECTIDRHFVFSVPASLTDPPLNPALLVAPGNSTCKPQRVTSGYALFKIPMDGCGTRRIMVGKTVIYMVEIINRVQTISLNYGTITRDSPVRLFIECRYLPGTVLSVNYLVKTPSLGPDIHTQGVFGVQLRIAKDSQYSSYHPQYHQPLQMLLGKPLYLEVRMLNNPDPSLVLLVHFCVAYPRSGKAVWLLLYNGCPNPLDPAPQQTMLFDPQPTSPRAQTRRFTISTFQFLPDGEFKDSNEEIYFMCSTEICSPRDGPCVEGCFGQ